MARRNPNVSVNIDLEADAGSARKAIAKDLGKIEADAKDTAKGIERAFENLSPELDTSEIRQALDLAGKLDGMVAEFTVDTDLDEIKQAEAIARSLRSFQGRVDLSVEGRAELADTLDLAEKMDQIRKVKVEVQGREDLEKAAELADDLERRRTVDIDVDDSEVRDVGDRIDDELSEGGERGSDAIAEHLADIDFEGIGASGKDQMIDTIAAAGPWGAAAATVGAVFADDFLAGFQDSWGRSKSSLIRGLRTGLADETLAEVGEVAGELYVDGFGDSMDGMRDAAALIADELGDVDRAIDGAFDLKEATRQALTLSEIYGVDLADSVAAVSKLISSGLVESSTDGFEVLNSLGRLTGQEFEEALEVTNEFSTALAALGIDGPQGIDLIGQAIEMKLFPQIDQAGEVFEEFREELVSGGSADALEELALDAGALQDALARGDGAEAMATIARALLELPDPARRAALAAEIFGGNMALVADPDLALQLFAQADGVKAVGNELETAADKIEDSRSNLEGLQRGAEGAGSAFADGLNDAVGVASEGLIRFVEHMSGAEIGTREFVGGAEALSTAAREGSPQLDLMAMSAEELGDEFQRTKVEADQVKAALEGLTQFGYDQSIRDIRDAADELAASFADGNAKLVGYGGAIDTTTSQGRTLQSQFEQLTSASIDAEVAYANGEITSLELARAQAEVGAQFDRVTGAAGLTQVQVDGLRAKYLNLPSQVTTKLSAIDESSAVVQNLQRELGKLPTSKTVTITTRNVVVAAYAASTQSREGRAAGGPVKAGRVYEVGELGRELFMPDEDGTIIDHRDTAALLDGNPRAMAMAGGGGVGAGASGGAQEVRLVIGSDGSAFGRMVVQAMRKETRNRGGIDVVFDS